MKIVLLTILLFFSSVFTGHMQTPTVINVLDYGAVCDGAADDTAGIQAAITAALAPTLKTREVVFPAGVCRANIVLTEVKGIKLRGAGSRLGTKIRAIGTGPALAANGLWYSQIEGITFETENALSGKGPVDIDGNFDGIHTLSVQGNTFKDCYFAGFGLNSGGLSDYAFTMMRQGQSAGQGSENLFLNCHFAGANVAAYWQRGYNALNNTFIGGNFQSYKKHGIYIIAGSVQLFSVAFQSTYQYQQIINDGYDIDAASGGVGEGIAVVGCRTESLRFYRGGASQRGNLLANVQNPGASAWTANTSYALNAIIIKSGKLYRVTTAGVSGASEPTWPGSGTVPDGSAIWTQTNVDSVVLPAGDYNRANNLSFNISAKISNQPSHKEVTANYSITQNDNTIYVDSTSGPRTITLSSVWPNVSMAGQRITVKRHSDSQNAVTISFYTAACTNFNLTLPGGTLDAAEFVFAGGGAVCAGWRLVNYYEDRRKDIAAAGMTGDRTVGLYRFSANLAPGASMLTVTNPLISSSSIVLCNVQSNDATLKSVAAVPAAGSVALYGNAATTNQARVSCIIQ